MYQKHLEIGSDILLCTTGLNFHIEAEFHFCDFNS